MIVGPLFCAVQTNDNAVHCRQSASIRNEKTKLLCQLLNAWIRRGRDLFYRKYTNVFWMGYSHASSQAVFQWGECPTGFMRLLV